MDSTQPTTRRPRAGRIPPAVANVLVAVAATLVGLLGLELAFRIKAHLENRETFSRVFESGEAAPMPRPGKQANLAHLIRPSAHRRIIYELRPGLEVSYRGGLVRINENGFRGPARSPQAHGAFRVVGLGDSVMFGNGVSEGETFLDRLETRLNLEFSGRRFEVINTGVPGYNTAMEVESLKLKGLEYEPDLVIVLFVGNDIALPNFIRQEAPVLSLRQSFLWSFVRQALRDPEPEQIKGGPAIRRLRGQGLVVTPDRETDWGRAFPEDPDLVPPQYRDMVGWGGVRRSLRELKDLGSRHGFEVVVALFWDATETRSDRARAIAEEIGLHVVDTGPAFRGYMEKQGITEYRGSPLSVSEDDPHPSALGHRIMADAIFDFLVERRLLGTG